MKNIFVVCLLLISFSATADEAETFQPLNPAQYACAELEATIQQRFFDKNLPVTLTGLSGANTYVSANMACPSPNQRKVAVGRPTADIGIGICDRECFVGFACIEQPMSAPKHQLIQCDGGEYLAPLVVVPNFAR